MRTNKVIAGGYYSARDGITFRVDTLTEGADAGRTVYYTVVARTSLSRSRHRVGTSDFMGLVSFASRVDRRVTRRCKTCRCTDARACGGGCSWAAWDLCSACVPVALQMPVCM